MVESYLLEGNQKIDEQRIFGKSITIRVLVGKIQRDYCIRLQKCARMD